MIILITTIYYSLAILGLFFWRYLRKFIATDFYNDKTLNRKRIFTIIYFYFILVLSAVILGLIPQVVILQRTFLVISGGLILIIFGFLIPDLESPPKYRKRKKFK